MNLEYVYSDSLRRVMSPVTSFDAKLRQEAEQMISLMRRFNGIGLAANQVNLDKRLIVIGYEPKDNDDMPEIPTMALVNPVVVGVSQKKETMVEGCLSLPGVEMPVIRSSGIQLKAFGLSGRPLNLRLKGLTARVIQHEIDHLNGVLFTDYQKTQKQAINSKAVRAVFFGSDEFSLPVLEAIIDSYVSLVGVITETAKPAGRGQDLRQPLVAEFAFKNNLPLFQPKDKGEIIEILSQLSPDLIVLASYGKILPSAALALAPYGGLNLHPSLLPELRGATPIQTAIVNGLKTTGVTLMRMVPDVDAGPIIAQEMIAIKNDDFLSLRTKLSLLAGRLLKKKLPDYIAGQTRLIPQGAGSTTRLLTKEDGKIDWTETAATIVARIRAYYPWPGSWTEYRGEVLKIIAAEVSGDRIRPITVQLAGKKPVAWEDFRRGHEKYLTDTEWFCKLIK